MFITEEMILDELRNNKVKYPTKDSWLSYVSDLSHNATCKAMLLRISNGGNLDDTDEVFKLCHKKLMFIGKLVWDLYGN